jgi:signal transduction histidine kinase
MAFPHKTRANVIAALDAKTVLYSCFGRHQPEASEVLRSLNGNQENRHQLRSPERFTGLPGAGLLLLFFLALDATLPAPAENAATQSAAPTNLNVHLGHRVTDLAELRRLGTNDARVDCPVQLAGTVLWVAPYRDVLALKQDSGTALIEMNVPGEMFRPPATIIVEGVCTIEGERLSLRHRPLVNNDGMHGALEKTNSISLAAGKHSIHLSWFNHLPPGGLEVAFEGPEMARQKIPDSALFRAVTGPNGSILWTNGLNYRAFEGTWDRLPNWRQVAAVTNGIAGNFDSALATRAADTGLDFTGYIEIPRLGIYTFFLTSDDGALLSIDEQIPKIQVTGAGSWPEPSRINARQTLTTAQQDQWSSVEGTVTFASEEAGVLELDLSSGSGRIRIEMAATSGVSPEIYLNRRVRATGIAQSTFTTDGQRVAGKLLSPGVEQIEMLDTRAADGSDRGTNGASLPLLTTIAEVKRLSREEAQRGYPVQIRGVITAPRVGGFFIQDSTWSIYVRLAEPGSELPRAGDYWEIAGATFAEFAPNILASRATRLGPGTLPDPLRPAWDQLINGSLDTQYIEVQGIVTAVKNDEMVLLTRVGKLKVRALEAKPEELPQYENALIRVRGCVMPARDITTQKVEVGRMDLCNASIAVDEPAPADPFATPLKRAADLLLFDPRAGALRRVKLAGHILHRRGAELFLVDGTNGFRATLVPGTKTGSPVGDLVEVVGFPELGGASPILREALVQKKGRAALPMPLNLEANASAYAAEYDSTLVAIQSRLVSVSVERADQVLVAQSGAKGFVARLQIRDGVLPKLLPGSRIELTGVFAGQRDRAFGPEVDSFELLLNSPADVRVITRPSWWTFERTLALLGGMAALILGALVWITVLRRKVEERSQQLATEIRRHEQTERQRELEGERARIARDLHDDLGASLTQIRFLSALESRDTTVPETTRGRMGQISEKSRDLVTSLDEIVWAVNPANDSLPSLAIYLCQFAEEFFRATPTRCRLDVDDLLPSVSLTSEVRHNVYLGFREALNNVAKHSRATEVWIRIQAHPEGACIIVEDNGIGFDSSSPAPGEGLANMRARLAAIGGRFKYEARVGAGTTCRFDLLLNLPQLRP